MDTPLLDIKDLTVEFGRHDGTVHAVNGIAYDLLPGEMLAVVGESGCGKSVSALAILRLIASPPGRITRGSVLFEGEDLLGVSEDRMREIRGNRIAMIFQEPMTSLNPVLTIGLQIIEPLLLHLKLSKEAAMSRAAELLDMVGIPDAAKRLGDYPHQFSGGMRQRVMIAIALSCNPRLLIADEPTTALDVTIQAQILDLIQDLGEQLGTAVILITHNLGVVARYVDRVNVMYAGRIIEQGTADEVYANPKHPYTKGLLASVPRLDGKRRERLVSIEGMPPDLGKLPDGCAFHERCVYAIERCATDLPVLASVGEAHVSACWMSDKLDSVPEQEQA